MYFGLHIIVTDCPYGPKEICQNGTYGYSQSFSYKIYIETFDVIIRFLPNYKEPQRFSEKF